jgi:hypothetical protein
MSDRLSALFCVGCGRVDVSEPCVGACDERTLDLILAKEYDAVRTQTDAATRKAARLRELLIRLVSELPEPGGAATRRLGRAHSYASHPGPFGAA